MTDSTLNRFIASGTNAERLAFTPDPPTPGSGPDPSYIWAETDTGDTFAWDYGAAVWQAVGGGSTTGLSTSLSQVSSSLSSEISSRASGDTSLSTVISSEVSSRISGDTSLSTVVSGSISTTLSTAASATASLSTAIGSGGGAAWALAGSGQTATGIYDQAVDGTKANIDFTGLSSFNEVRVIARNLTASVSGVRRVQVSTDNGSSFYSGASDYLVVSGIGVEANAATPAIAYHGTNSTAARTLIAEFPLKGAAKESKFNNDAIAGSTARILFVGSASDIDAIRINCHSGGNITGGTVHVYAR